MLEHGAEAAAIILTSPPERSIPLGGLKRYVARRIRNSGLDECVVPFAAFTAFSAVESGLGIGDWGLGVIGER